MKRKPAEKFQDLIVWQKAHALVLSIYKMTRLFPREELFGLTSQMRRRRGRADVERIRDEHPELVNSVSVFNLLSPVFCLLSSVSCLLSS